MGSLKLPMELQSDARRQYMCMFDALIPENNRWVGWNIKSEYQSFDVNKMI
jgi:hypothetical protein